MPIEYTDPIELTELPQLIRAVNTKTGYLPSVVVDATYTQIQVATPTFNPGSSVTPYPISVTINCDTSGAAILYSIDGSEPSLAYTEPVEVSSDTPLKAKATKANYLTSDVGSAVYTQAQVPIVTFSPNSSTVVFPQTVYLATTLGDADIYYTVGSNPPNPTIADILYDPNTGIVVNSAVTIKAFGVKAGYVDGDVSSATYTQIQVATPTFSQSYSSGGSYWYPNTVTLSCATSSVTMYYTIDGSTPTTSSTLYSAPFAITSSMTVKALAVRSGYLNSAIGSRLYDQQRVTTTPTITQNNSESGIPNATGALYPTVVTITGESGSTFRYTVDGSTPDGSSTLYSAAFNNLNAATIKVKSFKTNYVDSAVTTQNYTQRVVVAPGFSHASGEIVLGSSVSISTTTPGCSIYYTTDGSTPDNTDTLYTAPVTISSALTLKAIAYKTSGFQYASWATSSVASATYIGPLAPAPTITPDGSGAYEFPVRVVLTAAGADAIYYTVDGSTPDNTDTLYSGNYFTITDTTTVKAVGTKTGYTNSAVVAATITKASSQRRGWASPASGAAIPDNQTVTITGTHDTGSGLVNPSGAVHGAGTGSVYSVLRLRSGKFLVTGDFGSMNYSVFRRSAARVFPEYGVTDTTFVDPAMVLGSGNGVVMQAAELPDGSLILVGRFTSCQGVTRNNIVKLTADGTLVTAFTTAIGGTGLVGQNPIVNNVAYYNNKIYVLGNFSTVTPTGGSAITSRNYVVLNLDGTVAASSFMTTVVYCRGLAIDKDGKMMFIQRYNGSFDTVSRLNVAATGYDSSPAFNSAAGTLGSTSLNALYPLSSGKVLVTGGVFLPDWGGNNNNYWPLVRLNNDGTVDNTFTKTNQTSSGLGISVDLDGKIYLGHGSSVKKFNADGTEVTSFTTNLGATQGGAAYSTWLALDYGDRPIIATGANPVYHVTDGNTKTQVGLFKIETDGNLYRSLYGNNVKFTLNGDTPTAVSSDWPGALSLNQDAEVFPTVKTKIRSIPLTNFEFGTMDTYSYTWAQVATPTATPAAGTIGFGATVALSCATSGVSIYYTVDGSTPDNTDTLYTAPITVSAAVTIKAIAYKTDYKTSEVLTAAYTQATVATPTASPASSTIAFGTPVTLTCATSGASIYYTIDGSSPALINRVPVMTANSDGGFVASASSVLATFDPFNAFDDSDATSWLANTANLVPQWVQLLMPTAQTISAYAVTADTYVGAPKDFKLQGSNNGSSWTDLNSQTGITWSGTERKQYTISSPASYTYYRLYISAVQNNAYEPAVIRLELLRYGATYSTALTVDAAQTIKAIGLKTGWINSSIMSEAYTQAQAATPVATPVGSAVQFGSTVALACSSPSGAAILYTIDGSAPLPRGPIARWRLDGNGTDSIGGITANLATNAAFVGGGIASGQALSTLSGGYTFASSSASFPFTGGKDFSIVCWIKTSYAGSNGILVGKHTVGIGGGYFLGINTSGIGGAVGKAYFYNSGSGSVVTSTTTVNDNTWHQIIGVYGANGKVRIYVDGAPSEAMATSTAIITNTAQFVIGGYPSGNLCPGLYNDVQLYDRALTSAEVAALYATPASIVGDAETLLYSTPLTVNSAQTIKAIALKADYLDSATMSEAYTQAQLADVVFNPVDGTSGVSLVTLTHATSGTTIRYTTNGSTPTISNGFTYSGGIGIVTPKTVKAYAYKTGYVDGNVATATYP